MNTIHPNCPCKRTNCERHGNCVECKQHHQTKKRNVLPTCERLAAKKTKKEKESK